MSRSTPLCLLPTSLGKVTEVWRDMTANGKHSASTYTCLHTQERPRHMSIVVHEDQDWRENRAGSRIQLLADPTKSVSGLALVNQICQPGVGAPSHVHEFEEIITVVDGSAEVWVGQERRIVGPGTSVFIGAGTVHGFRNTGDGRLSVQAAIASTELRATYLAS
jgi:quercetin dioxygenase-like cupin family protein